MAYDYATNTVLSAMYAPNDRLGVELMGAVNWNVLKRAVSNLSANAVNKAVGTNPKIKLILANKALNRAKATRPHKFRSMLKGSPLCAELLGMNEDFAAELLGYSLSDLWRQTKNVTHNVLNAGAKIPVVDAAVERFRDITGVITGTKQVADTAAVVYDNRGKIILIGAGAVILLYFLLRKKK
jgi:hypothetical protein